MPLYRPFSSGLVITLGILASAGVLLPYGVPAAARPPARHAAHPSVHPPVGAASHTPAAAPRRMQKRWLFVWRDMSDPKEIDRMIQRFPRAKADGYNGIVFSYNIPPSKAAELKQASKKYGMALIPMLMGGPHDPNYEEGMLSRDALYIVHNGAATLQQDNPTRVVNSDFEDVTGNHFNGWAFQDDEGVMTFADHAVTHGGKTSLRMENMASSQYHHCRIAQPVKLQPHRQYRISFWLKTENLSPSDAEVKMLTPDSAREISFQSFHSEKTQDWTHYDLVFNSMDYNTGMLYLGIWDGKDGKMWWDDVSVDEIGLVNVLRRPGCPVTVRAENGATYEEGQDYQKIVDPLLHPWQAYHDQPVIRLTPNSRIPEGQRLRVSYYHPIIIYEDRITGCLSEPKIFDDWRAEVKRTNDLLHPLAFFMEHDELRTINQCALCRSKHMTPGQLLAWNVHKAAGIIRQIRPDAEIWVWSDMFDPYHNAVDHFYAVDGSLKGSWKGLDPGIGIVNWNGGAMGKDCPFFAALGEKQILSGYYDGDEDGSAIAKWIANTKNVPGIVGAMYTTWGDNYGPMDVWAQKAWYGGQAR